MKNPDQTDLPFCRAPDNEQSHAAMRLLQIRALWQPRVGAGRIVWGRLSNAALLCQQEIQLAPVAIKS